MQGGDCWERQGEKACCFGSKAGEKGCARCKWGNKGWARALEGLKKGERGRKGELIRGEEQGEERENRCGQMFA